MSPERKWVAGSLLVVAVTVVLEIRFPDLEHAKFLWHRLPAFDFLYGFAGCAFITLAAKAIGKTLLQRPEGYYEEERKG